MPRQAVPKLVDVTALKTWSNPIARFTLLLNRVAVVCSALAWLVLSSSNGSY